MSHPGGQMGYSRGVLASLQRTLGGGRVSPTLPDDHRNVAEIDSNRRPRGSTHDMARCGSGLAPPLRHRHLATPAEKSACGELPPRFGRMAERQSRFEELMGSIRAG